MSLSCQEMQKLLPSYIDGMLSEKETEAVKAHLSACEACQKEQMFLSGTILAASSLPGLTVTDSFRAQLHEKLMAAAEQPAVSGKRKRLLWRRASGFAAAAAVVMLSVVAFGNLPKPDSITEGERHADVTSRVTQEQKTETEDNIKAETGSPDTWEYAASTPKVNHPANQTVSDNQDEQTTSAATPSPPAAAEADAASAIEKQLPEAAMADMARDLSGDGAETGTQPAEAAALTMEEEAFPASGGAMMRRGISTEKASFHYTLTAESYQLAYELLQPYEQDEDGVRIPVEDVGAVCQSLEDLPGYIAHRVEAETPENVTPEQTELFENYVWIVINKVS